MMGRRGILRRIAALVLCVAAGLSQPDCAAAQPVAAPPIPSGMARVWMLRLYEPYVSLATPMLFVNGTALTPSLPGSVFYRDFAPGTYTFSVASYGVDYGQAQTVPLFAGEEVYYLVWCDSFWASGPGFTRDTFYVLPIPPPVAWQYMRGPYMRDLGAR